MCLFTFYILQYYYSDLTNAAVFSFYGSGSFAIAIKTIFIAL